MGTHISSSTKIYIADSATPGAGRGVFARERIQKDDVIETCPIVALHDEHDRARLRRTGLVNYYFLWGKGRNLVAICLGWGSVYNHSFNPNARYEKMMDEEQMVFYALDDIKEGEEIFVNYNGDPSNTNRLSIPGIPAAAGGPLPSRSRIADGIARRLRIARTYFS